MHHTIPGMLANAAERDGDRVWLQTDEGQLSFAAAASQVGRAAARLRDAGVSAGDRVVITARNTPPYLLTWLAVCSLGAVAVPTNPVATAAEFDGLLGQVRPLLVVSDPTCFPASTGSTSPRLSATGASRSTPRRGHCRPRLRLAISRC
jgi:carnitine-CoA ligase